MGHFRGSYGTRLMPHINDFGVKRVFSKITTFFSDFGLFWVKRGTPRRGVVRSSRGIWPKKGVTKRGHYITKMTHFWSKMGVGFEHG